MFLPVSKPAVMCNKKQRARMEARAGERYLNYKGLLDVCSRVTGRTIKGIGMVTWGEAQRILKVLATG